MTDPLNYGVLAGPDDEPYTPEEKFAQMVQGLSHEYDNTTLERHEMGAEKYGPSKFLTVDTLQEALDELADLGNYIRYTWIKLRLLQESIADLVPEEVSLGRFVSAADATTVKEPRK